MSARALHASDPVASLILAIALGLASLLTGGWGLLRGRWELRIRRLLAFVGQVLIVVGIEIVPAW